MVIIFVRNFFFLYEPAGWVKSGGDDFIEADSGGERETAYLPYHFECSSVVWGTPTDITLSFFRAAEGDHCPEVWDTLQYGGEEHFGIACTFLQVAYRSKQKRGMVLSVLGWTKQTYPSPSQQSSLRLLINFQFSSYLWGSCMCMHVSGVRGAAAEVGPGLIALCVHGGSSWLRVSVWVSVLCTALCLHPSEWRRSSLVNFGTLHNSILIHS